ncbi:hypothetical protein SAMN05444364_1645 [Prevotella scopos JCM 17725]|uniref:Uncharacterized protein n=1 Tax=Prevotella scopos JCM 17725 TaxID=1236518 RepID=A0AAX2F7Q1_9BACT|nr:hypothetical protein SAMN05444364_1645 [Prevotella scopos JCM 17725]
MLSLFLPKNELIQTCVRTHFYNEKIIYEKFARKVKITYLCDCYPENNLLPLKD